MEILLRWFATYDKDGKKSPSELQYWDSEIERWNGVSYIECNEVDEFNYILNKHAR